MTPKDPHKLNIAHRGASAQESLDHAQLPHASSEPVQFDETTLEEAATIRAIPMRLLRHMLGSLPKTHPAKRTPKPITHPVCQDQTIELTVDPSSMMSTHEVDVSSLISTHEVDISSLMSTHEADLSSLMSNHEADLSSLMSTKEVDLDVILGADVTQKMDPETLAMLQLYKLQQAAREKHEAKKQSPSLPTPKGLPDVALKQLTRTQPPPVDDVALSLWIVALVAIVLVVGVLLMVLL
ncbi:MAG: hypothetical protein AAFX99_10950 [Myxococcota bacterium]